VPQGWDFCPSPYRCLFFEFDDVFSFDPLGSCSTFVPSPFSCAFPPQQSPARVFFLSGRCGLLKGRQLFRWKAVVHPAGQALADGQTSHSKGLHFPLPFLGERFPAPRKILPRSLCDLLRRANLTSALCNTSKCITFPFCAVFSFFFKWISSFPPFPDSGVHA